MAIVAFNRGIRRIVDYNNGYFDPYSPISLTPLVVGGLAAAVVVDRLQSRSLSLGPITQKVLRWYVIACGLALIVGFYYNRFGAIYDLGNYLAPLGMIGFGAIFAGSKAVAIRWAKSAVSVGSVVAIYGLYQFYTIPPWDAFWVRAVGFEGYLGILKPTKMTLFSTMNERGPAGGLLAQTLILLLLRPKAAGFLQIPLIVVTAYAMLLTYVRTALIQVVLACFALPIVTKGRGLGILLLLALFFASFGEQLLSSLPGSSRIVNRYSTLGNIQNDGSFQGRMLLVGIAAKQSIGEPLGAGMGSHGLAGRVSTGQQTGVADSTGYLEVLRTFGWVGAGLIVAILRQCWLSSAFVWRQNPRDFDVALFRAWFISGMVVLFSGNWLASASYFWLLAGCTLGRHDLMANAVHRSANIVPSRLRPSVTKLIHS